MKSIRYAIGVLELMTQLFAAVCLYSATVDRPCLTVYVPYRLSEGKGAESLADWATSRPCGLDLSPLPLFAGIFALALSGAVVVRAGRRSRDDNSLPLRGALFGAGWIALFVTYWWFSQDFFIREVNRKLPYLAYGLLLGTWIFQIVKAYGGYRSVNLEST